MKKPYAVLNTVFFKIIINNQLITKKTKIGFCLLSKFTMFFTVKKVNHYS